MMIAHDVRRGGPGKCRIEYRAGLIPYDDLTTGCLDESGLLAL